MQQQQAGYCASIVNFYLKSVTYWQLLAASCASSRGKLHRIPTAAALPTAGQLPHSPTAAIVTDSAARLSTRPLCTYTTCVASGID